ncbi:hypothetical protein L3V79_09625, partial [Thiotrichales bacterium 19S9-12]|nr:hypothetical protein [Thiotrichales bacterium 19S9-11]MCF6812611.1 hypothetical protein [Thiotrichales bacterium 19S9-12]
ISPVTARNINITLPELNNVKLVSNTCGENLPGYDKCQVIYQAGTHPSGSSELTVSGDNFASTSTTIEASTPAKLEASVSPTHITTNSNVNKKVTVNVTNNSHYPVSDLQVTINSSIASFDTSTFVLDTTNSTCNSDTTLGIKESNNACQYVYTYEPGKIEKASYPDVSFEVTANNSSNSAKAMLTINNYPQFYSIPQNMQRTHNSMLSNNNVVSVSVANDGKIYAGTKSGVSILNNLSVDQWYQLTSADNVMGSLISSTFIDSNGVVYLGGSNRGIISISNDNGLTWQYSAPLFSSSSIKSIYAYVKNNSTIIYAGGLHALKFSIDHGTTWQNCTMSNADSNNPSIEDQDIKSIYVSYNEYIYVGTSNNGLYISAEPNQCAGKWNRFSTKDNIKDNTKMPSNNINSVYVDSEDHIYIGTNKGLSYSKESHDKFGRAQYLWTTVDHSTTENLPSDYVTSIYVDTNGLIYAGTDKGLSVSNDSLSSGTSLSWQQYNNDHINNLKVNNDGLIYEGTDSGLLVYNNISSLIPFNSPNYAVTSHSPVNYYPKSLFVDQNQNIYLGSSGGGLYISSDGGMSWQNITASNEPNGLASNKVYSVYVSDDIIYAGTLDGLSYSNDNGSTWRTVTSDTTGFAASNNVQSVFANGNNIYVGTTAGLSYSNDNGSTWQTVTSDTIGFAASNNVQSVFANGNNIYVGTTAGLSYSSDSGSTWRTITSDTTGFAASNNVQSVFANGNNIYAGTLDGLSYSNDDGATWATTNSSTEGFANSSVRSVFVDQAGKVYVAGNGLSISNADMTEGTKYDSLNGNGDNNMAFVFVDNKGTIYTGGTQDAVGRFISKMEVSD